MVEVEARCFAQNRWIPADCHMNARPYIGPAVDAHPSASPYPVYASISPPMPEVIFPGPEGRLEGRFHPGTRPRAPVALILHSHPQAGGTMNNKIVQLLYQTYVRRGFATLRFNFRGVGKSQGVFDNGIGELSDAASALDWVQSIHPEAETTWVAGVSFGAWIGMQLLMRRPEIKGFISIAPPANMYDFSFLAPCPSSGIIIQGEADEVVTPSAVQKLVDKLRTQRHITIHHDLIPGANHFFANELDLLMKSVDDYLDMRLATDVIPPPKTGR
jgi:alpha/beta superfamily hydrolase